MIAKVRADGKVEIQISGGVIYVLEPDEVKELYLCIGRAIVRINDLEE